MPVKRRKNEDWHDFHDRCMRSKHWQEIRAEVLRLFDYKCGLNNNLKPSTCLGVLDVHHRTYDRLGDEDIFDLIPLCRHHHEAFHAELNEEKSKPKKRKVKRAKKAGVFGWF